MSETASLGLPLLVAEQGQKHVTHNEALRLLDALVRTEVVDRDLTAPPGSPAEGSIYIPASGASGDWSAWDFNLAHYIDGAWEKIVPKVGWLVYVVDEDKVYKFEGAPSYWVVFTPGGDMLAAVYDPGGAEADAFDMANMVEAADAKVMSAAERTKLAGVESGATVDQSDAEIETAYNNQVSVVSQAEAEAGTATTARRWTAERVAQAIAAQAADPGTDLALAELALQVADLANVALFLGESGNRVADSFDDLTYVDDAGATNLDPSEAGVLKPLRRTLAMHMDGADGSTTFTDEIGHTVSIEAGSPEISTDQSVFGGASLYLNGSSSISVPKDDFDLADNDFYIRFWVRFTALGAYKTMIARRLANPNNSFVLQLDATYHWQFGWTEDGSSATFWTDTGAAVDVDTDYFFEISRSGGTIYFFANGALLGTDTSDPTIYYGSAPLTIGRSFGPSYITGYIDDLEIYVGEPGHISGYAPPASAFTPYSLTITSEDFSAASAPSTMSALLYLEEIEAVVAGTDYTFEVSRDGGTTWTAVTLSELYTFGALTVVEGEATDVSGQPSGTTPKWRFKTVDNDGVALHAAYLYWS